jgi:hypothetical protein
MLKQGLTALVVLATMTTTVAVEAPPAASPYSMASQLGKGFGEMPTFYGSYGGHYGAVSALQNPGLPNTAFGGFGVAPPVTANKGFTYQVPTSPGHPNLPVFPHYLHSTDSKLNQNYTQFGPNSFGPYPFTGRSSQLPTNTPFALGQHTPGLFPGSPFSHPFAPGMAGVYPGTAGMYPGASFSHPTVAGTPGVYTATPMTAYPGAMNRNVPMYHHQLGMNMMNQYQPGMNMMNQYQPGMNMMNQYQPGMNMMNQYQPGMNTMNAPRTYFPSPYSGYSPYSAHQTMLPVSHPMTPYTGNAMLSTPYGFVPSGAAGVQPAMRGHPLLSAYVSHGFPNPMTDRYAGVANEIPAPKLK